jgi:hypothetical protein
MFRPCIPLFAAVLGLASCTQPLPTVADLEDMQTRVKSTLRYRYDDLESRRSSLSDEEYEKEKTKLDDLVVSRATDLAWNRHNMAEVERENHGIPTPDAPQHIVAPTGDQSGGNMRKFNQNSQSMSGNTSTSAAEMNRMMRSTNTQ